MVCMKRQLGTCTSGYSWLFLMMWRNASQVSQRRFYCKINWGKLFCFRWLKQEKKVWNAFFLTYSQQQHLDVLKITTLTTTKRPEKLKDNVIKRKCNNYTFPVIWQLMKNHIKFTFTMNFHVMKTSPWE